MKKILISSPQLQPVLDKYIGFLEGYELIVPEVNERLTEDELIKLIPGVSGVICGDDYFTKKVLEFADKLEVISKWGTGVDSIDVQAYEDAGIPVKNTTNAFTYPVADTVMSAILHYVRIMNAETQLMRMGKWEKPVKASLCEMTLGIIGVGNIGQEVAQRAHFSRMTVYGIDIKKIHCPFLEWRDLDWLLEWADIVTLHCDLNEFSYHLIGERELDLMDGTFIINTARGPLIDEKALIGRLETGQIPGAALDVFEEEPLPIDSKLRYMSNVMLSAHNANMSPMCHHYVHCSTINNMKDVLNAK